MKIASWVWYGMILAAVLCLLFVPISLWYVGQGRPWYEEQARSAPASPASPSIWDQYDGILGGLMPMVPMVPTSEVGLPLDLLTMELEREPSCIEASPDRVTQRLCLRRKLQQQAPDLNELITDEELDKILRREPP